MLTDSIQILSFPTGLMFDSAICQYHHCELSPEDKVKINQDRLWVIMCEEVIDEETIYQNFEDEVAEVLMVLGSFVENLLFFEAITDLRKLSRQRFLLSI